MKPNKPVTVEEILPVEPESLWKVITVPEYMRQWFFENIPSFLAKEGFEIQFYVKSETRDFLHQWKVTEVVPRKRLTLSWRYGGFSGQSYVTFELNEQERGCQLKVIHTGIESFPDDVPEFTRESCQMGWNYFIKDSLKKYLST